MIHISLAQFTARFATLVLKGNGIPNKQEDRHILFISAVKGLESGREYSDKELNDALRVWSTQFGERVTIDHVTLRRALVDERYIDRNSAGTTYRVKDEGFPCTVDPEIRSLNLQELIAAAIQEIEDRKSRFQQKN